MSAIENSFFADLTRVSFERFVCSVDSLGFTVADVIDFGMSIWNIGGLSLVRY